MDEPQNPPGEPPPEPAPAPAPESEAAPAEPAVETPKTAEPPAAEIAPVPVPVATTPTPAKEVVTPTTPQVVPEAAAPDSTSSPQAEPPSPPPPPPASPPPAYNRAKENSPKAIAKRRQKLEKCLEKIIAHARAQESITNRDVVKLLRVSDATASRYLAALVSRGRLLRNGKGRSISYAAP